MGFEKSKKPTIFESSAEMAVYEVEKELGGFIEDHGIEESIVSKLLNISKDLPMGGRLVIDFKGVKLFSPIILLGIIKKVTEEGQKRGQGILKGRFVMAKDPNDNVLELLRLCVEHMNASLLVVCTDPKNPKKIIDRTVLNLPVFLKETLDIVEKHGPISSREVEKHLGEKKGTSGRERLRQLFRRGLVKRRAVGTFEGRPYFEYVKFPDILE